MRSDIPGCGSSDGARAHSKGGGQPACRVAPARLRWERRLVQDDRVERPRCRAVVAAFRPRDRRWRPARVGRRAARESSVVCGGAAVRCGSGAGGALRQLGLGRYAGCGCGRGADGRDRRGTARASASSTKACRRCRPRRSWATGVDRTPSTMRRTGGAPAGHRGRRPPVCRPPRPRSARRWAVGLDSGFGARTLLRGRARAACGESPCRATLSEPWSPGRCRRGGGAAGAEPCSSCGAAAAVVAGRTGCWAALGGAAAGGAAGVAICTSGPLQPGADAVRCVDSTGCRRWAADAAGLALASRRAAPRQSGSTPALVRPVRAPPARAPSARSVRPTSPGAALPPTAIADSRPAPAPAADITAGAPPPLRSNGRADRPTRR